MTAKNRKPTPRERLRLISPMAKPNDEAATRTAYHVKLGEAFRDLESDLNDLKWMHRLTSSEVERATDEQYHVSGYSNLYYLTPNDVERLLFAVFHTGDMLEALWDKYYAAFEKASAESGFGRRGEGLAG